MTTEEQITQGLSRRQMREMAAKNSAQPAQEQVEEVANVSKRADAKSDPAAQVATSEGELNLAQREVLAQIESAIEVSSTDSAGKALDRRALRVARNREFDRLLAEWERENGPLADYTGAQDEEAQEPVADATDEQTDVVDEELHTTAVSADAADTADDKTSNAVAETNHLLPTQALSVADIAEAESIAAEDETESTAQELAAEHTESEKAAANKRKLWPFGGAKKVSDSKVDVDSAAESLQEPVDSADVAEDKNSDANSADSDAEDGTKIADRAAKEFAQDEKQAAAEIATANDLVDDEPEASENIAAESTSEKSYSFPDIAPLDEDVSVFDDDSTRIMRAESEDTESGFDTLINRAVADENNNSTSGTSALILPAMPVDATTGSFEANNNIFVSGSIELPRAVSETGGHHSLLAGQEDHDDDEHESELYSTSSTKPVSALRAVSSQHAQTNTLVEKSKKDSSKAPAAFAIGGGVLVLGAIGVVIAAVTGVFG